MDGGSGGGGAICSGGASLSLTNCIFRSNHAQGGRGGDISGSMPGEDAPGGDGGDAYGGAIIYGGALSLTNCTFTLNLAQGGAGGSGECWYWGGEYWQWYFCPGVASVSSGGGMHNNSSSPTVANCILWGDTPSEFSGPVPATATYSCVQGGYSGEGNIDLDPSFVDAVNGDLRLIAGSPCIDTGTPNGAPATDILGVARPQGAGFDMGAYESTDPVITQQPLGGSFYVGDSFTFTVAAAYGMPPLSYQGRLNGSDIGGATSTDLALDPLTLGNAGDYDCVVTDSGIDSATSDPATLLVAEHIAIVTDPVSQSVPKDSPVTFTVVVSGGVGPISYQWRRDDMDLTDASLSAYTIASAQTTDAGDYDCAVTDEFNAETIYSEKATLTVIPGMPVAGGLALEATVLAAGLLAALRLRRRTK